MIPLRRFVFVLSVMGALMVVGLIIFVRDRQSRLQQEQMPERRSINLGHLGREVVTAAEVDRSTIYPSENDEFFRLAASAQRAWVVGVSDVSESTTPSYIGVKVYLEVVGSPTLYAKYFPAPNSFYRYRGRAWASSQGAIVEWQREPIDPTFSILGCLVFAVAVLSGLFLILVSPRVPVRALT